MASDTLEHKDFMPFRLNSRQEIEEIGLKLTGHATSPKGVDLVTVDGRQATPVPHHTTSNGFFFHKFILKPTGTINLNFAATQPLSRISFFPPDMPTTWDVGPFIAAMCHFSSDFMDGFVDGEFGPRLNDLECGMGTGSPRLDYLGQMVFTESRAPGFGARLLAEAIGTEILVEIARRSGRLPVSETTLRGGLAPWQTRRLDEYVREHLAEDLSLQSLADLLGISQRHLSRTVKREKGMSVHRWIAGVRLAEAMKLLAEGNLPLAAIAQRVAFKSPTAFSSAFRAATGLQPSEYRKLTRE